MLRAAVDRRLRQLFPVPPSSGNLDAVVRQAVLAPGKRLRPVLTVLASWEFGAQDLRALDAGCAIEMVHAASLIFDDLPCMDDARMRRGQPATHVAFGEDAAVLAGISLIGRAFSTLGAAAGVSASQQARLVGVLANAIGSEGLAGGQFRDLRGQAGAVAESLSDANHRKTGALFVAAAEMAGIVTEAPAAAVEALRRFATELGQAFQILDDLDDGEEKLDGLAEDDGKANLRSLLGPESARRRLSSHLAEARRSVQPDGSLAGLVSTIFGDGLDSRRSGFRTAEPAAGSRSARCS